MVRIPHQPPAASYFIPNQKYAHAEINKYHDPNDRRRPSCKGNRIRGISRSRHRKQQRHFSQAPALDRHAPHQAGHQRSERRRPRTGENLHRQRRGVVVSSDRLRRPDAERRRHRAELEQHRPGIDVHEFSVPTERHFRKTGDPAIVLPKVFFIGGVPPLRQRGVQFRCKYQKTRIPASTRPLQNAA